MNHYNRLRSLLEVKGTESTVMKQVAAVSAKLKEKARIKKLMADNKCKKK